MQSNLEEKLINPDQDFYSETMDDDDDDDAVKREESEPIENLCDENDEEEDEEEEFSFMCGGEDAAAIAAEDAFIDGQIKPVFPLFNQDLFFSAEDSASLHENLPMRPPVKKIFVETKDQATTSVPENDEIVGPYCDLSSRKVVEASPEVCKKSNSTGFSKIWRLREFAGRCNSDGRDAFVFLNNSGNPPPHAAEKSAVKTTEKESTVEIKRVVKKGVKSKTAPLSAHEVYLRSKAKDEERRRSYLPYKPELMGFFTNVNGGLTKNVHPF